MVFPPEDSLVTDKSLQMMLLQVTDLRKEMTDPGGRTSHLEHKVKEFCVAHNEVADRLQQLEDDHAALKHKIADIEDRMTRNNIRFRGMADLVCNEELPKFLLALCKALVPHLEDQALVPHLEDHAWAFDHVHCLPRPQRFTADTPRDTKARFHYFQSKDQLFNVTRKLPCLPEPYQGINVFAGLSATTMMRRKELINVTKTLRNHKISYPTKLLVWHKGSTVPILELEVGISKLKELGHFQSQKSSYLRD
ncbi:Hypothetical predicted protein [Pelobates cultripes]|uniref:Uncharacterized protein n=1 Tax=Pelobates cultripes TaxID=61616 RepID=A0AAD1R5V1_PELCU|nr:Hypothetical predicted protein [Pelobates cultripes]